jgi:hypothetical protein
MPHKMATTTVSNEILIGLLALNKQPRITASRHDYSLFIQQSLSILAMT